MQSPTTSAKADEVNAPDVLAKHELTKDALPSPIVHGDALDAFILLRPRLARIAARMLNSVAEAEDLVQDVWLRWQSADRSLVAEPAAFLTTITTRLAIKVIESARVRHESYVGTSIPDRADTSDDPFVGAERAEALEIAFFLLMKRLTPTERAAYILREAFEYPYRKIAGLVHLTEPNTRQLVSRARKRIVGANRTVANTNKERSLLDAFIDAAQHGNSAALEEVLLTSSNRSVPA